MLQYIGKRWDSVGFDNRCHKNGFIRQLCRIRGPFLV